MPKFPDISITVKNPVAIPSGDNFVTVRFPALVGADGVFSALLPDHLADIARAAEHPEGMKVIHTRGHWRAECRVLDTLKKFLTAVVESSMAPEVEIERVIQYSVASHISFFEGPDGKIYPSGEFKGAGYSNGGKWNNHEMYGRHDASHPSIGGYSLTMAAMVMDKRTIRLGEARRVEYARVRSDGDENDPIRLLNSWVAFTLPNHGIKEMPYTPEAAMFFHRMLMDMALLSRRIQTFFSDDKLLLEAINGGALPMITRHLREKLRGLARRWKARNPSGFLF